MKAKTGNERAAAHAARMREQGLEKVSFSKWVPADKAERIRASIDRAVKRELNRD